MRTQASPGKVGIPDIFLIQFKICPILPPPPFFPLQWSLAKGGRAPMPAGASVRLAAHPDTVDHRPAVEILTRHAHCVPTACVCF